MERIAGVGVEAHDRTNGIRARGPACLELVGDFGDADRGLGTRCTRADDKALCQLPTALGAGKDV